MAHDPVPAALDHAQDIRDAVVHVRARIRDAARRSGRDPDAVRLLAATKGVALTRIGAALDAGIRLLGENRVQEALPKIAGLDRADVTWHFIGRLQRRKVRDVIGRFAMIESVDRLELAEEIDRRAAPAGLTQAVLLEVNLAREPSKTGFAPDALADALRACDALQHLDVCGLMAIPPAGEDPEAARPYFRRLRELAESGRRMGLARVRLRELSMGMSSDFDVAIEEGATIVRIGTALFGERFKVRRSK